jgi:polyisoprenyl-phosphate glycosyltransferase
MKHIAIIVPVYNESDNLEFLYSKLDEIFSTLSEYEWGLIFVNDGSVDNSW